MQSRQAQFYGFQIAQRGQAVVTMGVELHRRVADVFKNDGNQSTGSLECQETTHVLEADPYRTHGRRLSGLLRIVLVGMAG